MLTFREIGPQDHDLIVPMAQAFYYSDAVDHPVDAAIVERSFRDAADPAESLLRGLLIQWDREPAGYMYITQCYSAEVGGRCVFIEEIYLEPQFRRRGLGAQALALLEEEYPDARRFRLEVTQTNQGAVRLYKKAGYKFLNYEQMVLDKIR